MAAGGSNSSDVPPGQQLTIDKLTDLIVCQFRRVELRAIPHGIDRRPRRQRLARLQRRSHRRFEPAMTVQKVLTAAVKKLWDNRNMGPPPVGGVEGRRGARARST